MTNKTRTGRSIAVRVQHGDALKVRADVLALKYAQGLYGVDRQVAAELERSGLEPALPNPWEFCLIDAKTGSASAGIAASKILFVGVPWLWDFGYREIRVFARKVLSALAGEAPGTRHLSLTIHGPGYGLDEIEAFEAEVAGLVDGFRGGDIPESLENITFVERNEGRAERLAVQLEELLPELAIKPELPPSSRRDEEARERVRAAGYASDAKAHVFVAMPFKEDMDDTYHYGIQGAVRAAGYLCERADLSSSTGDVLEWVRGRIRTASLVVADLTDPNPNVYLEVGYAWGCGVTTVLLVRDTAQLPFNVRGQRCVVYRNIKHLEDGLAKELKSLKGQGNA